MQDDYLCIKEVEKIVHVALSPAFIGREVSGVIEVLENWKRSYIQQLSGVVVSFKNISLSSGQGSIITDQPFIHYDVKATFSLFTPSVGNIIRGKINRISNEHIGCVVHDVINVSIRITEDTPDSVSQYAIHDSVIYFKVTSVDFNRRQIRVKGKITLECIELMGKYFSENPIDAEDRTFPDPPSDEKRIPETVAFGLSNDSLHEERSKTPSIHKKKKKATSAAEEDYLAIAKVSKKKTHSKHHKQSLDNVYNDILSLCKQENKTDSETGVQQTSPIKLKKHKKHISDLNDVIDLNKNEKICKKNPKEKKSETASLSKKISKKDSILEKPEKKVQTKKTISKKKKSKQNTECNISVPLKSEENSEHNKSFKYSKSVNEEISKKNNSEKHTENKNVPMNEKSEENAKEVHSKKKKKSKDRDISPEKKSKNRDTSPEKKKKSKNRNSSPDKKKSDDGNKKEKKSKAGSEKEKKSKKGTEKEKKSKDGKKKEKKSKDGNEKEKKSKDGNEKGKKSKDGEASPKKKSLKVKSKSIDENPKKRNLKDSGGSSASPSKKIKVETH